MKLIVGLGNIGSEYTHTRHNIGFDVVDGIAKQYSASWSEQKNHHAFLAKISIEGTRVMLAKPTTFMNLSGQAVQSLLSFYQINPKEDLLIVQDEIDLATDRLSFIFDGGPAGHNGILDIQERIGKAFARLRVGVGRPLPPLTKETWVLTKPIEEEKETVQKNIKRAQDAAMSWVEDGLQKAMSEWNKKI